MNYNYKDACITCLETNLEKRHVHTVIKIAGVDVRLSDILQNSYQFQVPSDDLYPDQICITCVYQLTMTYSFRVLLESSAKTLDEHLCQDESNNDLLDSYETDEYEEVRKPIQNEAQGKITLQIDDTLFCVECKGEFSSQVALREHCTTHHSPKNLVGRDCEYCYEKFEDFRSLVLHRKLHQKPFICDNCWMGFLNESEINVHTCMKVEKNKEYDKLDKRQCDECGKSYPSSYIRIHKLTHSEDRAYSCKYCSKKFKVPGGLHSHILWNHKRTRNHKCDVCNATFISSSARSSHIRKNHLQERKYPCKCGKRFFSKSELDRHMLTHTGIKNFHCHLCEKSYQTRYGLNVHLKAHSQMNSSTSLMVL